MFMRSSEVGLGGSLWSCLLSPFLVLTKAYSVAVNAS